MTEQTALATGEGERSGAGGDGEIARSNELTPGSGGQGVHTSDDGLRNPVHELHQFGTGGEQFERGVGGGGRWVGLVSFLGCDEHVGEVVPSGEHGTLGGKDDAVGIGLCNLEESRSQLVQDVEREGVALGGVGERDDGETALAGGADRAGHGPPLWARRRALSRTGRCGAPSGARTQDPRIKSPLLYQLS